jgi:hypothetical protein
MFDNILVILVYFYLTCYVKNLSMSYECAVGWYDRYDIYVHIKFRCAAHNFTGRVIQSTGNGMGTRARKDHAHCFTGMTKLRSRKKAIILHWWFFNLIQSDR